MSTHPGMLIAYDEDGNVIATLDYAVLPGPDGKPLGLVDFAAHEEAGGEHTAIWKVASEGVAIKGSKVWPEYLGQGTYDFMVELDGPAGGERIAALVHKVSGYRRERDAIEAAIVARIDAADGQPADIRDLVGGPDRPLRVSPTGVVSRVADNPMAPVLPFIPVGPLTPEP